MVDCIEETGRELNLNNQGIVRYLCGIEEERKSLETIIQKQYQERKRIEAEIEKLTYKLCLINKSLSMRIKAKNNYDKTIEEIKGHYECLVASSNKLRQVVEKTQQELDGIMNKKTGTNSRMDGDVKILYVKSGGEFDPNDCICNDVPTKERSKRGLPQDSSKNIVEGATYSSPFATETPPLGSSTRNLQSAQENSSKDEQDKLTEVSSQITAVLPAEVKRRPADQEQVGRISTSKDTSSRISSQQLTSNRNLSMFLSKLRPSVSKSKSSTITEDRLSKIEPEKTPSAKRPSIDNLPSETNHNRLIKRSMKDILNANDSQRGT